jgi:hypothetical protein
MAPLKALRGGGARSALVGRGSGDRLAPGLLLPSRGPTLLQSQLGPGDLRSLPFSEAISMLVAGFAVDEIRASFGAGDLRTSIAQAQLSGAGGCASVQPLPGGPRRDPGSVPAAQGSPGAIPPYPWLHEGP